MWVSDTPPLVFPAVTCAVVSKFPAVIPWFVVEPRSHTLSSVSVSLYDVKYLPSKSTVISDNPVRVAVIIPLLVLKDNPVK